MPKELFKGGKFPFRVPFFAIPLKLLFPSTVNLTAFTSEFCHRRLLATRRSRRDPPVFPHSSVGLNPFPPKSIALAEVIVSIRGDRQAVSSCFPPSMSPSHSACDPGPYIKIAPLPRRGWRESVPAFPWRLSRQHPRIHENGEIRVNVLQALFRACAGTSFLRRSRLPSSERYSCCRLQDGS